MPPKRRRTTVVPESNDSVDEPIKYISETCVKIEKIHHTWKINNFSFFHDKQKRMIESPEFADKSKKHIWSIRLKTQNGKDDKHIGLFLRLVFSRDTETYVIGKFKLSAVNAYHEEKMSRSTEHRFVRHAEDWGWNEFVLRSVLYNSTNNILPNDELIIICDLEFASPDTVAHTIRDNVNSVVISKCSLTDDFANLLKSKTFSDVTLTVEGKDFRVHKAILSARCSVFAAMFRNEMRENSSNRVEITDIDKKILNELLRYIYTGEVRNLEDVAYDLLAAADKYDLERLKNICETELCKKLDAKNAAEMLLLADSHNTEQLKKQTVEFIKTCISEVINTDVWNNIVKTHPHLINEVCAALAK